MPKHQLAITFATRDLEQTNCSKTIEQYAKCR